MKIVKYVLAGFSAFCLIAVFILTFIFSSGFNPTGYVFILFFSMNIVYLLFANELSQPNRILKIVAGYFAFTALKLEHRANIAEIIESKKSEKDAIKAVESNINRNDRLDAAEQFLKLLTIRALKQDAIISFDQKQILNAKNANAALASPMTLAEPDQAPSTSDKFVTTAVREPVSVFSLTNLKTK